MKSSFVGAEEAIAHVAAGRMVVVTEPERADSGGSVVCGAASVTPDDVNFMARYARGLICLALAPERCDQLGLLPMTRRADASIEPGFMISIEARHGVTTGISAHDRARTIAVAIDPASDPRDLIHPGHVFPIRASAGGVLARSGPTEAAVDLARLAGLAPAGVVCRILSEDGMLAGPADLRSFCERHQCSMLDVDDLVTYRLRHEQLVERVGCAPLPTVHGEFAAVVYRVAFAGDELVALVSGEVIGRDNVLTALHSRCLVGDTLGATRCDCGRKLKHELRAISREGGVLVMLGQKRHARGLIDEIGSRSPTGGADDFATDMRHWQTADDRDFSAAAQILRDLNVTSIRLIADSSRAAQALGDYGVHVAAQVLYEGHATGEKVAYLPLGEYAQGAGAVHDADDSWMPSFEMAV
jgi:3,4-dihydroxy 2-butanone 4-phosphate synthase/GTP cyclohydrolase II